MESNGPTTPTRVSKPIDWLARAIAIGVLTIGLIGGGAAIASAASPDPSESPAATERAATPSDDSGAAATDDGSTDGSQARGDCPDHDGSTDGSSDDTNADDTSS